MMGRVTKKIGALSDTHGFLSPELFDILADVDHIVHAGDIGSRDILTALETIAPVTAVYGNMDGFEFRKHLKAFTAFDLFDCRIELTHILEVPKNGPTSNGKVNLKFFGHTHQPLFKSFGNTHFINPGSAGKPSLNNEYSAAVVTISGQKKITVKFHHF